MDRRSRPSKPVRTPRPLSTTDGSPRVIPFPRPPASEHPARPEVTPGEADSDAPDVICDLGAYHRLAKGVDRELDRMQHSLDKLADDVEAYRFPTPAAPDDDQPRPAA